MSARAILIGLTLLSVPLQAELLEAGKFGVHQAFGYATHSGLWAGSTNTPIAATAAAPAKQTGAKAKNRRATQAASTTGSGRVDGFLSSTRVSSGVGYGIQLDAKIDYKYVVLQGNEGGRKDGDSVGGFSELGFRLNKLLLRNEPSATTPWSVVGFVGFRAPGNASDSADDFLALSDGTSKFDLGLGTTFDFGSLGITVELTGILRTNTDLGSQTRIFTGIPVYAISGVVFGPSLIFFNTWGGIDIGDAEFTRIAGATGNPPFSQVKEDYLSLGVFIAVPITTLVTIDATYQRKVVGRNSDIGNLFTAGLGLTF